MNHTGSPLGAGGVETNTAPILIVEDDSFASRLLQVTLRQHGYLLLLARTGAEGVDMALSREPAVVLLDLGLPDFDGVEVTRQIRQRSDVPIIVVSARGQEHEKVAALDHGANDYVTKPFAPGELLARIRVALRRAVSRPPAETATQISVGGLTVSFDPRKVTVAGVDVHLTPTEYRLLVVMIQSAGHVLSHRQILRRVWGLQYDGDINYLRVYMRKLRYKLEPRPAQPQYLINEPGVGYRFRIPT